MEIPKLHSPSLCGYLARCLFQSFISHRIADHWGLSVAQCPLWLLFKALLTWFYTDLWYNLDINIKLNTDSDSLTIKDQEIFPRGYKVYRKDRVASGGGVLICTFHICTLFVNKWQVFTFYEGTGQQHGNCGPSWQPLNFTDSKLPAKCS